MLSNVYVLYKHLRRFERDVFNLVYKLSILRTIISSTSVMEKVIEHFIVNREFFQYITFNVYISCEHIICNLIYGMTAL